MICACQMMATESKPIRNTQNASATLVCDSAAGRRRGRTNQAIKGLLVPLVLRSFVHAARLSVRTSTLEQSQFHPATIEQGRNSLAQFSIFSRCVKLPARLQKFVQRTLGNGVSFLSAAGHESCQFRSEN